MSENWCPIINGALATELRADEQRKIGGAVRLRIQSDGTFHGTRVIAVQEDGTEHDVRLCDRIDITITPRGACAAIHVSQVEVDALAVPTDPVHA